MYAAFLTGGLDRPKVCVFADHLDGLTGTQIAAVCAALLPVARRLTPGQLGVRLRRLVAAIDPRTTSAATARRYATARSARGSTRTAPPSFTPAA